MVRVFPWWITWPIDYHRRRASHFQRHQRGREHGERIRSRPVNTSNTSRDLPGRLCALVFASTRVKAQYSLRSRSIAGLVRAQLNPPNQNCVLIAQSRSRSTCGNCGSNRPQAPPRPRARALVAHCEGLRPIHACPQGSPRLAIANIFRRQSGDVTEAFANPLARPIIAPPSPNPSYRQATPVRLPLACRHTTTPANSCAVA